MEQARKLILEALEFLDEGMASSGTGTKHYHCMRDAANKLLEANHELSVKAEVDLFLQGGAQQE